MPHSCCVVEKPLNTVMCCKSAKSDWVSSMGTESISARRSLAEGAFFQEASRCCFEASRQPNPSLIEQPSCPSCGKGYHSLDDLPAGKHKRHVCCPWLRVQTCTDLVSFLCGGAVSYNLAHELVSHQSRALSRQRLSLASWTLP